MAVEQHPKYPEWREALDHMIEAEERYFRTKANNGSALKAAEADRDDARKAYDKICSELD